jgi:hypothetical protein
MVDGDDAGCKSFAVDQAIRVLEDGFGAVRETLFDDAFADPFGPREVFREESAICQNEIFGAEVFEGAFELGLEDFSRFNGPLKILFQTGYGLSLVVDCHFHDKISPCPT